MYTSRVATREWVYIYNAAAADHYYIYVYNENVKWVGFGIDAIYRLVYIMLVKNIISSRYPGEKLVCVCYYEKNIRYIYLYYQYTIPNQIKNIKMFYYILYIYIYYRICIYLFLIHESSNSVAFKVSIFPVNIIYTLLCIAGGRVRHTLIRVLVSDTSTYYSNTVVDISKYFLVELLS